MTLAELKRVADRIIFTFHHWHLLFRLFSRDNTEERGEISFEISIIFLKTAQYRLKAQAKSFCSDEMRKFAEQNNGRME